MSSEIKRGVKDMLNNVDINKILGIEESYQVPQKMLDLMLNDKDRVTTFESFLEIESDLSHEWFQNYFETEHSDRKVKKQDFTPQSIGELGAKIIGKSDSYFEATAGTGGMMIQFWKDNKNSYYEVEELSDRVIPFLLFNMAIRNMSGVVKHGDSLIESFKVTYQLKSGDKYSSIEVVEQPQVGKVKAVLMNPPYSASWSADKEFLNDTRFRKYEKLAPRTKADYAFLLHGFSRLENGVMALVCSVGN